MPDPLVLVCGVDRAAVLAAGEAMAATDPGTALVVHDLRRLGEGVVTRSIRLPGDRWRSIALELAHGCVSCTLREDLLPLLLRLASDPTVGRVGLLLDPGMEPEPVCEALAHLVPDGADGPVTDVLEIAGVVAVLDGATWLDDAGSDEALADRAGGERSDGGNGLVALTGDDDRTVARIVVGHAEFADVLVVTGGPDPWERIRRDAVLARLAPQARRLDALEGASIPDVTPLLRELHPDARRGVPDDPHGPLLRGQPPLARDVGVSLLHVGLRTPFHPQRLHEAFEVLLTGTVRVRGRVWVASRPDHALWIESAGGGLQIGMAGHWLASAGDEAWEAVDAERRASASLRWDERWGDREQQLVILVHDAEPADVVAALDLALLTEEELALGEDAWRDFDDPFGTAHSDPCDELDGPGARVDRTRGEQA